MKITTRLRQLENSTKELNGVTSSWMMYVLPRFTSPGLLSPAISDVNASKLIEAVAALKVGRSSQPGKRPSANTIIVEDTGEIDSGYASKNGSQSSTPESSNFRDGGAVLIGNASRWSITKRKKIKLTPFDKDIPRLTQNRFEDLRELHADNLVKLTRGSFRCRGILMSLKVLGESESTAEPWVFIQCDKAVARKVGQYFKQRSVESDFKPPNPDAYTPNFEIYVHEMPPLALGSNSVLPPTPRSDVNYTHQKPNCTSKRIH
jgi:hypothetical protein